MSTNIFFLTDQTTCRQVVWREHTDLFSIYSMSSFLFSVTGVYLLVLYIIFPERAISQWDSVEAIIWVWSGILHLGITSWSHPVDRVSATLVVVIACIKYAVFSLFNYYPICVMRLYPAVIITGMYCFHKSCLAVKHGDMTNYFFWHTMWHFTMSFGGIVCYSFIYLYPSLIIYDSKYMGSSVAHQCLTMSESCLHSL